MVKGTEIDNGVAVPEPIMDALNRTLASVEELETHLPQFLSLSEPQVLSQLHPLHRAHSLFLLARITSTLFTLKLRCRGVDPDEHPVKSELDRLRLYQDKLERLLNLTRPSTTTLNCQAATRFLEHSLPDLTAEQRQNMNISIGEGQNMNYQERAGQKRKDNPSSENQSVQTAFKEFLEKAPELLDNNAGSIEGPIMIDISDDDDDEIPVA